MKKHHFEVILEDIQDKFSILIDALQGINERLTRVEKAVEPIPEMQSDIKAIKHILKDHSWKIDDHDVRIVRLEEKTI